ncbi:MAG: PaaI family thioesterase [Dethiobacter sp.]|nr:PaaI family thioesterase [Dethiobacter sp.]MCL5981139.1 PaaI family thioesterase [Bacillota bacterium]
MLEIMRQAFQDSPYWQLLGIRIEHAEPGFARLVLPFKNDLLQLYGQVHGGSIASLIDSSVAVALSLTLSPAEKATTTEMKVNYLEPVRAGEIYADSKIRKKGKTLIIGTTDVMDENGRLLAIGTVTYMVLKR